MGRKKKEQERNGDGDGDGEGERFVLKRSRDAILKKYGSLNAAFKRVGCSLTQHLTQAEFERAVADLLRRGEARFLYERLSGRAGTPVALQDALNKLEEI